MGDNQGKIKLGVQASAILLPGLGYVQYVWFNFTCIEHIPLEMVRLGYVSYA